MVHGLRFHERHRATDGRVGEEGGFLEDAAGRLDERRNPCVRGAGHRPAIFHGPHRGHRQGMMGCAGAAVPGVIADIHQKVGAVPDPLAADVRKDGLITDQRPYPQTADLPWLPGLDDEMR